MELRVLVAHCSENDKQILIWNINMSKTACHRFWGSVSQGRYCFALKPNDLSSFSPKWSKCPISIYFQTNRPIIRRSSEMHNWHNFDFAWFWHQFRHFYALPILAYYLVYLLYPSTLALITFHELCRFHPPINLPHFLGRHWDSDSESLPSQPGGRDGDPIPLQAPGVHWFGIVWRWTWPKPHFQRAETHRNCPFSKGPCWESPTDPIDCESYRFQIFFQIIGVSGSHGGSRKDCMASHGWLSEVLSQAWWKGKSVRNP